MNAMLQRRRKSILAAVILTILGGAPLAAGLVFLVPNDVARPDSQWIRLTDISTISDDALPHRFQIYEPYYDAWARLPDRVVGGVFLRRLPGIDNIIALRADHHAPARMPVVYTPQTGGFTSSCWNISFTIDGKCIDKNDRFEDIERLQTRIQNGVVFVRNSDGIHDSI